MRLLYGNDKRNPVRTLDLAETAPGNIRLKTGGFAPGSGERVELWSGRSIRFDGERKLAESRNNSRLAVTSVLKTAGSQAALSYFQRKISEFFLEAKRYQIKYREGQTVWLEYRWSDGLGSLPTPTFGQLSHYYEIYSANAPKWPDDLHNDFSDLEQGLIEALTLELTGSPYPEGLRQMAATAGGAISLNDRGVLIASGSSSRLHWSSYSGSGLIQNFAVTGWFTLNAAWSSGTKDIFDYYVDASNRIRIQYDAGNGRFVITKIVSGTTYTANSSSFAIANGDDVHLVLVQNDTTLYLYANGSQVASVTATNSMTDGGTIALGCPATGTIDGVDIILDGWRILPDDISAAQVDTLYDAELPIKQDGGQVGSPPYWLTQDGDGQLDNGYESGARQHWGVIGGVGGDVEAKLETQIDSPSERYIFWLGVKSAKDSFDPALFWFESTFATVVANSDASAGSYSQMTLASGVQDLGGATSSGGTDGADILFGKCHFLLRLSVSAAASLEVGWKIASGGYKGLKTTAIAAGGLKLLSFGDMFITHPANLIGRTFGRSSQLKFTLTTTTTIILDFGLWLPAPFAKITRPVSALSASSYHPLIVEGRRAYIAYGNDDYAYTGDELVVLPKQYNYLFLVQLDDSEEWTRTDVANVAIYITPRHLLPGGMVA